MSTCICARCGEPFSSLELFDRHQDVDYSRRPAVHWRAPESLDLARGHRGVWSTPQAVISRQARSRALTRRRWGNG